MKRRRKPKRCSYRLNDGTRCPRVGFGTPPLCAIHTLSIDRVDGGLDSLFDAAIDKLGSIAHGIVSEYVSGAGAVNQPGRGHYQRRRQPGPPPPPPPPPPQAPPEPQEQAPEDPRDVLGFAHGRVLSKDEIKRRYRDLVSVIHPDHGGSEAAFRRIKEAADRLLAVS